MLYISWPIQEISVAYIKNQNLQKLFFKFTHQDNLFKRTCRLRWGISERIIPLLWNILFQNFHRNIKTLLKCYQATITSIVWNTWAHIYETPSNPLAPYQSEGTWHLASWAIKPLKKEQSQYYGWKNTFFFFLFKWISCICGYIHIFKRLTESTYLVRCLNPLCLTGNWEQKCCGRSGAQSAYHKAEIYFQAPSICLSATSLSPSTSAKSKVIISQPTCQTTAAAL